MEDQTAAGFFGTLSAWLQAAGQFAYDNIVFTLVLLWCFTLFAMTEFAKPFIRHFMKKPADSELFIRSTPQVLGSITGSFIAPNIVAATSIGAGASVPWYLGSFLGFLVGWVTIGIYMLSKNGKVIRFVKVVAKKFAKKIPFLGLTDEDITFIDTTVKGQPAVTQEMLDAMTRSDEILPAAVEVRTDDGDPK